MPNLLNLNQYHEDTIFSLDGHIQYEPLKTRFKHPNGTFVEIGIQNNRRFFRLTEFDSESTQALLITDDVDLNGKPYRVISLVEAIDRRQGFCQFLYKVVISSSKIPVISDQVQTLPGSVNLWQKLRFRWKQQTYDIGLINLNADRYTTWLATTPIHRIWGVPSQILADYAEIGEDLDFEGMLEYGDISVEHYKFLKDNFDHLKDRAHIRMHVQRK